MTNFSNRSSSSSMDELVGAKQNGCQRIVPDPAGVDHEDPGLCVEQGRWQYRDMSSGEQTLCCH